MQLIKIAVSLTFSFASLASHAEFLNSRTLLQFLESPHGGERQLALGYIMGVHDTQTARVFEYFHKGQDAVGCFEIPANATAETVRITVRDFLKENPSHANIFAYDSVRMALALRYPCKK